MTERIVSGQANALTETPSVGASAATTSLAQKRVAKLGPGAVDAFSGVVAGTGEHRSAAAGAASHVTSGALGLDLRRWR